jgi:hypothetical protein
MPLAKREGRGEAPYGGDFIIKLILNIYNLRK